VGKHHCSYDRIELVRHGKKRAIVNDIGFPSINADKNGKTRYLVNGFFAESLATFVTRSSPKKAIKVFIATINIKTTGTMPVIHEINVSAPV
jgi:hypothetical protein